MPDTLETLNEECLKFALLELPGQPRMMHMGTSSLVNRLHNFAKLQADEISRLRDALETIAEPGNWQGTDAIPVSVCALARTALAGPVETDDA